MPTGAIIGGVASLAGSAIQARSARSAARSQERAAAEQTELGREQLGLQREIYDDQTERFAPFLDAGTNALAAYQYELGLGERPTFGGTAPEVEVVPGQQQQGEVGPRQGTVRPWQQQQGSGDQYRVGDRTFDSREAAEAYAQSTSRPIGKAGSSQKTGCYRISITICTSNRIRSESRSCGSSSPTKRGLKIGGRYSSGSGESGTTICVCHIERDTTTVDGPVT